MGVRVDHRGAHELGGELDDPIHAGGSNGRRSVHGNDSGVLHQNRRRCDRLRRIDRGGGPQEDPPLSGDRVAGFK